MVFIFLAITLMESDTLSDDLVDTKTFDLSGLELDKVYQKTFVFRQVYCDLFCHASSVTQRSVTEKAKTGWCQLKPMNMYRDLRYFIFFFQTSEVDVEMKVGTL